MAIDLRKKGLTTSVMGVDANPANGKLAVELGLVDKVSPLEEAVINADVILVSIPVNSIHSFLPGLLDIIEPRTIVIDTGSTKNAICKSVAAHPKRNQLVAAHQIAGTENSGPTAAFAGLFAGKTNIICEKQKSSETALLKAQDIFDALGLNTIFMEPEEHDKHVAYVSHLSHVSSFLLGQTVLDIEKDEKNIFNLAGSGFASTVRLAKSSPEMWAPIFEQNSEFLSQALSEYIMHLQRFHYHLMKHDTKELLSTMKKANEIRRILK